MCVYVLDLTEAIETGRVAWLPVKGADLAGAPDEAIFYSLVEGRGELMMFGGIRGDARSLQRGSSSEKRQIVLNDVHFLSFCGANIRKHS
jgi:F-box protein 42